MVKHIAFFLALFIVSAYISMTVDAQTDVVTTNEILTLKSQAEALLDKSKIEQKNQQRKLQKAPSDTLQEERKSLEEIEKNVKFLTQEIKRLNEVEDMPLSRPEANHIKAQFDKIQNSVKNKQKGYRRSAR